MTKPFAALALMLSVAGTAMLMTDPVVAQAKRDWRQTVTITPGGSHIIGNPAARTKVIEYLSYTCGHCADFARDSAGPLLDGPVKSGRVSIEIRHAIRDRYDLTAAMLARCGGPKRFAANHKALYANFQSWIQQLIIYDVANPPKPGADVVVTFTDIAEKTGLFDLIAKNGVPVAQQKACLASKPAQDQLIAMRKDAWEVRKIGGTPAFVVNGTLADKVHDWPTLAPLVGVPAVAPAAR